MLVCTSVIEYPREVAELGRAHSGSRFGGMVIEKGMAAEE